MVAWAQALSYAYEGNMKSLGGLERNSSLAKNDKKPLQLEKRRIMTRQ
jgi:hypothetical protein